MFKQTNLWRKAGSNFEIVNWEILELTAGTQFQNWQFSQFQNQSKNGICNVYFRIRYAVISFRSASNAARSNPMGVLPFLIKSGLMIAYDSSQ